jgi:hypothetical protein
VQKSYDKCMQNFKTENFKRNNRNCEARRRRWSLILTSIVVETGPNPGKLLSS